MKIWTTVIGQRLDDADNTRSMLLCKYLMDRGHTLTMWTSAWDHIRKQWRDEWRAHPNGVMRRDDGLAIRFMKGCGYAENISPRRLLDHWLAARDFTRQARQLVRGGDRPDIIVASLPDHVTASAAVAFAKEIGSAAIVDVRDKWPDVLFDLNRGSRLKFVAGKVAMSIEDARTKRALASADCLVAMMNSMLSWGLSKAGRARSELDRVYYLTTASKNFGVERPALPPDDRISMAIEASKSKTIFTFTGTFNRSQHPSLLLDAIELLHSRGDLTNREVAFLIGGAGMEAEDVERRAAALPGTYYLGWLKPQEMDAVLGASDVGLLLMGASSEAFNNKTFSYLASGLPIINCATGDLRDLIEAEDLGVNISGGDPESLAAAIITLLNNPLTISRMKANVQSLFLREFSQSANYSAYADHVIRIGERGITKRVQK